MKTKVEKVKCYRCGHEWVPQVERPMKCPHPKCQTFDPLHPPKGDKKQ